MNREELVNQFKDRTTNVGNIDAEICAGIAEQYHTSLIPKPTDSAKEVLRVVSCNGMREMTEERILEAMEQYAESAIKDRFIQMMEEEPQKMAQWALLIMGIESRKCNADELTISEEADIEGSRYLINAVITTYKV
jgi:hypothetical protein